MYQGKKSIPTLTFKPKTTFHFPGCYYINIGGERKAEIKWIFSHHQDTWFHVGEVCKVCKAAKGTLKLSLAASEIGHFLFTFPYHSLTWTVSASMSSIVDITELKLNILTHCQVFYSACNTNNKKQFLTTSQSFKFFIKEKCFEHLTTLTPSQGKD